MLNPHCLLCLVHRNDAVNVSLIRIPYPSRKMSQTSERQCFSTIVRAVPLVSFLHSLKSADAADMGVLFF